MRYRLVAQCLALLLVTLASVILIGWALGIEGLKSVYAGISMKANTAVALGLAGLSLGFLTLPKPYPVIGSLLASGAALIGAVTLSQHLTGVDLGIDQLLFIEPPGSQATASPGRMGPNASLSLLLCGAAMVALHWNRAISFAQWAACTVVLFALLPIVGYLYGAVELYGLARYTGIAVQTAVALFLLAVGILLSRPGIGPFGILTADTSAGETVRRLMPVVLLVSIAIGWLRARGDELGYIDPTLGTSLMVLGMVILLGAAVMLIGQGRAEAEQDREEQQAALISSEARFRALIENVPLFVWSARPDGALDYHNPGFLAYLGTGADGPSVTTWIDMLHPDDRDAVLDAWQKTTAAGDEFAAEFRLKRASDGAYRWFVSRAVPLSDTTGAIVRWYGFVIDVDEQKTSEEALRRADRQKDEFIATLAHELRNPLAPLRSGIEILRLAGHDGHRRAHAQSMMERQVGQMVRLIDDLLDVSRITTGKLHLRMLPLDLNVAIRTAVEACTPDARTRGDKIEMTIGTQPLIVAGDEVRLTQVVTNLINNSTKYSPDNSTIRVKAMEEGSEAVVRVTDSGIGIPLDRQDQIFEMFAQIHPASSEHHGGLGIGLHIVRRLVEMHGGSIIASSEGLNRGSEFEVRLPLLTSAAAQPTQIAEIAPAERKRILVVDDNRDAAEGVAALLELLGQAVVTAHDGMEALSVAETHKPSIVLLDLGMPNLSGYEVARRIRQQPWGKAIRLVALSGWGQDEDKRRTQEAGFDSHITKPASLADLEGILIQH